MVAAQSATLQSDHVAQSGATILEYATQDESLAAVRAGEADAVFGDTGYLAPSSRPRVGNVPSSVSLGGIGLRECETDWKAKLDEAITSMKDDGSLNALLAQWFGEAAPSY